MSKFLGTLLVCFLGCLLGLPGASAQIEKVPEALNAIQAKVKERAKEVIPCYERSPARNRANITIITIELHVDEQGRPVKVTVDESNSDFKDENAKACIVNKLKAWHYPPAPHGQIVQAFIPFKFQR